MMIGSIRYNKMKKKQRGAHEKDRNRGDVINKTNKRTNGQRNTKAVLVKHCSLVDDYEMKCIYSGSLLLHLCNLYAICL